MRLFFALELPPPLREHLVRLQDAVRPHVDGVSMVKAESLHLTLRFLGEVADDRVPALIDAAKRCAVGPMVLKVAGLALLPPRGRIRVLAAGLAPDENLSSLQRQLESAVTRLGFTPESRPHLPHITFGRARQPLPAGYRARLADTTGGIPAPDPIGIDHFSLLKSDLRPTGAQYTTIAAF